jgi:hypothetical protein
MCGRYRRTTQEEELARLYHIPIPFKNDVAGFGMRERAVGDFVDPHAVTLEVKHALAEVGIAGRVAFLRDDERARGVVRFEHDQLAGVVVVGEGARWSWHGNVKCGCRIHSPKR